MIELITLKSNQILNEMKTNSNSANKLPHMGSFIKRKIDEQKISYAEVSKRLNIKPPTINGYFYQETLQTRIIWKLSQAIGYNLFNDLTLLLPEEVQNSNKNSYQESILEQQKEIEDLKKEIAIYKEILIKK